jgi:MFS family permease
VTTLSPTWRPTGFSRVAVIATLVAAMMAGTAMQFAAPILAPFLLPELGLGRAQFGALTAMYYLVGGLASPAAGGWSDRTGGRMALVATFVMSAAGFAVLAAARSWPLLLLAGAVGGLGAATSNPGTNRLVLASFGERARGTITGLKQSGVQLGAAIMGATLPPVALLVGWRATLLIAGGVLLLGIVLTLVALPAVADTSSTRARGAGPAERNATVTTLSAFAALMGIGISSVTTYLPVYVVEQVRQSPTRAGLVLTVVASLGVAARVAWGLAADRVRRPLAVLPVLGLGALVGVALFAVAPQAGAWTLWVGAAVFGTTAMGWNGVAMLVAMTAVSRERAGWATGRVILWFYLGLVLSPVPFGLLADRTGSYVIGWIGVGTAFAAASWVVGRSARRQRRMETAAATQR